MKFLCTDCGTRFERSDNFIVGGLEVSDDAGNVIPVPLDAGLQTECPACGRMATSTNHVTVERDGVTFMGFADTPEQVHTIVAAIGELKKLREDASLEQILSVLDEQGEKLAPVADYLRRHHLELAGLSVSLVALVVAVLAWLLPQGDERPVPDGITKDQMERLVEELERDTGSTPSSAPPEPATRQGQNRGEESQTDGPGVAPGKGRDR